MFLQRTTFAIALATVAACAPASNDSEANASADTTPAPLADNVHWFRNSAEMKASYLQSFRLAAMSVDASLAATPPTGVWGVIVDADETLLDNSEYQKERGALGWSADSWEAWTQRKEAVATPGSVAFLTKVHAAGGKIAVVTNRSAADCPVTEENLHAVGFVYDQILCQTASSDKNPRFQQVQATVDVRLWVGDNINDFPNLSQDARTDLTKLADFGSLFVVLANPMYGSWTSNPRD
jgi:5'-nucleotidase (lipoprotein e(P4) family)